MRAPLRDRLEGTDPFPPDSPSPLRLLLEGSAAHALVALDAVGRIVCWGAGAAALYGRAEREMLGAPYAALFPAESQRRGEPDQALRIAALQGCMDGEACRIREDGDPVCVRFTVVAVRNDAGLLQGYCDISTAADRGGPTVEALRDAEDRLARVLETTVSALLIVDARGCIAFANEAAAALVSTPREDLLGASLMAVDPTDALGMIVRRVVRTGEAVRGEERAIRQGNRASLLLSIDASPLCRSDSAVQGVVLALADLSYRRRAEEERLRHERRRALALRLVEVQETERRRIAAELHDEVGGALSGLMLLLVASPPGAEGPGALAEARMLLGEVLETVRGLSLDLRPGLLDEGGLEPALLALCRRWERCGLPVLLTCRLARRLPAEYETALYRIAQEALTNAARHAGASQVQVEIEEDGARLRLRVLDDGVGFDRRVLDEGLSGGLTGLRDRALSLDGSMALETAAGSGTRLTVEVPFPACPGEGAL